MTLLVALLAGVAIGAASVLALAIFVSRAEP